VSEDALARWENRACRGLDSCQYEGRLEDSTIACIPGPVSGVDRDPAKPLDSLASPAAPSIVTTWTGRFFVFRWPGFPASEERVVDRAPGGPFKHLGSSCPGLPGRADTPLAGRAPGGRTWTGMPARHAGGPGMPCAGTHCSKVPMGPTSAPSVYPGRYPPSYPWCLIDY
jgi:hypothetical protein